MNGVFSIPYVVRVADVNYGGHVSNAAVLNFFQDARISFLRELGDFSELAIGEGAGLILPEAKVRYRAEMFLGDQLQISVRPGLLRRSGFELHYRIERDGEVTAEGETVLVAFDYAKRKTRKLPDAFREALMDLSSQHVSASTGA